MQKVLRICLDWSSPAAILTAWITSSVGLLGHDGQQLLDPHMRMMFWLSGETGTIWLTWRIARARRKAMDRA
jgi:hypothetical protein